MLIPPPTPHQTYCLLFSLFYYLLSLCSFLFASSIPIALVLPRWYSCGEESFSQSLGKVPQCRWTRGAGRRGGHSWHLGGQLEGSFLFVILKEKQKKKNICWHLTASGKGSFGSGWGRGVSHREGGRTGGPGGGRSRRQSKKWELWKRRTCFRYCRYKSSR